MKKTKPNYGKIIWVTLLVILLVLLIYSAFGSGGSYGEKIGISDLETMIDDDQVESVYFYNGVYRIRKVGSEISEKDFPENSDFYCEVATTATVESIKSKCEAKNVVYDEEPTRESVLSQIMPYISLAIILIIGYFLLRAVVKGNAGTMGFGKSKARANDNIKVRFDDVAGADEEKAELQEVVEFLKNPQKFTELGARIPKGVLLVGPPGTGKTLLAKAVAGESNVPFLSISGSDFVEMFVGVGASRVRDLFEQAKKSRPCIIFIDEIDAVGRQRGTGLGGGNDEREQTLNQLLVEMDGFEANDGIIVLAATNRSDVLDPALLRPGRFDRQIYVHVPDVKGREAIIKIHAKNKPIDDEVDFQTLARITSGFTGADIENMLNEAAILAARADRPKIIMSDLTEGINKVIMGPQKKSLLVTERDKKITTYHESGHAILGKILENCDEVQEVSIIPRGNAAGYTMSRPSEDDNHVTYKKLLDQISMTMGGRIAEEIVFGDISTGAQNDIQQATELARRMVTEWGMSKSLGFVGYDTSTQPFLGRDYQNQSKYSEKTAATIDEEIREILKSCYERATKILKENRILMDRMSDLLILKETIYKEEVDMIMAGKTVEEIVSEMDKKVAERKAKEKKYKADGELTKKIRDMDEKLKTAEMLLKAGVIIQEEFDELKAARNALNAKLNRVEDEKQPEKVEEVKETAEPKVEAGQEVEPKPKKRGRKPTKVEENPVEKDSEEEKVSENIEAELTENIERMPKKRGRKPAKSKDENKAELTEKEQKSDISVETKKPEEKIEKPQEEKEPVEPESTAKQVIRKMRGEKVDKKSTKKDEE